MGQIYSALLWMIRVPDAFAVPVEHSGRVFFLQPLDNTTELLSYGADCSPPPHDASCLRWCIMKPVRVDLRRGFG